MIESIGDLSTTTELWLPVVDYEGLYEVSDLGRVWGCKNKIIRKPVLNGDGVGRPPYWRVKLCRDGVECHHLVHRLVLTAFRGPCPPGQEGCHGPLGSLENRLTNLRWDTHSENACDMARHGTHAFARRTHCPRNHPLVAPNLVPSSLKRNQRTCLACQRTHNKINDDRRYGRPVLDFQVLSDKYYAAIMAA